MPKAKPAGRRGYKIPLMKDRSKIMKPSDVVNSLREEYRNEKRECFGSVMLSVKKDVLSDEVIAIGTLDTCLVHVREVFRPAIKESASSVILIHNHPSGDPEPSSEDIELSRRVSEAGKIIGIEVLDFIIVGKDRWISFKEKGLI